MQERYSTKYIEYTRGKLIIDFRSMAHDSIAINRKNYRQAQYRRVFRHL
nr:MAG TPA: hypothetical protein [Caudoviricetes sp.]